MIKTPWQGRADIGRDYVFDVEMLIEVTAEISVPFLHQKFVEFFCNRYGKPRADQADRNMICVLPIKSQTDSFSMR
jgi:hypothetical protein